MAAEASSEIDQDNDLDPIIDIMDYLVRVSKISFKNAYINEEEVRASAKIKMACNLFKTSPINFLTQFGKYLTAQHMKYFENYHPHEEPEMYHKLVKELKLYHSEEMKQKRIRNRRYKAMQKLQEESDYFTEKEMMYRNPLLYQQLIGQYLTDEEIRKRDEIKHENLTFVNIILETVDQNEIREIHNAQLCRETTEINENQNHSGHTTDNSKRHWGEFDIPESGKLNIAGKRLHSFISDSEKTELYKEFLHEMYNSFVEGKDTDIDYNTIDNDEQYDDLHQLSQDAEDKYFDSEENEADNLEQHMTLVEAYGRKHSNGTCNDDSLDVFMKHLNKQNIDV